MNIRMLLLLTYALFSSSVHASWKQITNPVDMKQFAGELVTVKRLFCPGYAERFRELACVGVGPNEKSFYAYVFPEPVRCKGQKPYYKIIFCVKPHVVQSVEWDISSDFLKDMLKQLDIRELFIFEKVELKKVIQEGKGVFRGELADLSRDAIKRLLGIK